MRRSTSALVLGVVMILIATPGCSGLSDYLDELQDQSLECFEESQRAWNQCMAQPPPE